MMCNLLDAGVDILCVDALSPSVLPWQDVIAGE